jgi:rhodanese-related sulfurtransferase
METLLEKSDVNSEELATLLKARGEGKVDFLLVDVREDMEYNMGYIKGVDVLKPTSLFQSWAQQLLDETKEQKVILTCRTGNRSGQIAHIFSQNGHPGVINHFGGIVTYKDEIERV